MLGSTVQHIMFRTAIIVLMFSNLELSHQTVFAKGISPRDNDEISTCADHKYSVLLFSQDPLVIYIPDFISVEETAHLEEIT